MAEKERARQESGPIPNDGVWRDAAESKTPLLKLQAACLMRRAAVSAAMASILVHHLHGEVMR